ncbi:MAG: hypothetical protein HY551_07725 [Elusimicrobia bacterium]|nr:hypothetical protein [Elusimicrobiota bacterium]
MEFLENRRGLWTLLLALGFGIAGETLLFMQRHCRRVQSSLLDDFRVVVFSAPDLAESKAKVVEERLRALPDVEEVRFVSREAALDELKSQVPDLAGSVALLGENPLPPAFEVRLVPEGIARLPSWVREVSRISDVSDVRFKPAEARAIIQLEFYGRFLDVAVSLAAAAWFLAVALVFWSMTRPRARWGFCKEWGPCWAISALGAASGMLCVYLVSYPLRLAGPLWVWPDVWSQLGLLISGTLGIGCIAGWAAPGGESRAGKHEAKTHRSAAPADVEDAREEQPAV